MCTCRYKYVVTYPDGRPEETYGNATAARIAASRVTGATWKQLPK